MNYCNFSSLMTEIVQFTNYLRPMQFITLISILNERLKLLDDKFVKIKTQSDIHDDESFNFSHRSSSTLMFDKIEVYRENFILENLETARVIERLFRTFHFSENDERIFERCFCALFHDLGQL
jgi:hypothetical protein